MYCKTEYPKSLERPIFPPSVFKIITGMKRGFFIWCGLSGTVLSLEYFEFMKAFTIQISEFNVQMFLGIEQYVLYFLTSFP